MGKIAVLLADDHAVVREGLRALLAVEEDIEIGPLQPLHNLLDNRGGVLLNDA